MSGPRGGATIVVVRFSVLLVDGHVRFRSRARRILRASGYRVVGEAVDGRGAIAATASLHPELVLLDVQLPDLDGLEVASRLAAEPGGPAVVLVSNHDLDEYGPRVDRCGARGLIPKARLSPELLDAVLRGTDGATAATGHGPRAS